MGLNTRPMSASAAARKLEDILRWRLLPTTPIEPISAIRYDKDPAPTATSRFPFPVDTVETDGARGVETTTGADTWIELWASWLSWATNTPTGKTDGAWLLKTLQESKALNPLPSGEEETTQAFLSEWDLFTQELSRLWWRLATLTGHAPKRRSLCPRCKTGWLQSAPGRDGYSDQAACTNPTCQTTLDYSDDEIRASQRAVLRDPNIDPNLFLTVEAVKTIWPQLKAATLRSWARRSRVTKQDGKYKLADINRMQWNK